MKLIPKYPLRNRILSTFITCSCLALSSLHLMAQNNVPKLTLNLAYYGHNSA